MKITKHALLATISGLAACAATVPAELRDARAAYAAAAVGPAAELTPAELHKAHEALLAAETAWKANPKGYHTLDLAYVAQRQAEIAEGKAGIARGEKAKAQAQTDLVSTQAKIVEQAKSDLKETKGDLTRSKADLKTSQATTEAVTDQLSAEQLARKAAEQRAMDSQAALTRLAAVKEESRGLVITLSGSVLFRSDESVLLPEARVRLDQVAAALMQTKERNLIVEGHTDSKGSAAHNQDLSQRRAQSVCDYLAGRGYPPDHISAVGYGSQRPVADDGKPEGRANNRRVEIVVTPLKVVGP